MLQCSTKGFDERDFCGLAFSKALQLLFNNSSLKHVKIMLFENLALMAIQTHSLIGTVIL